MNDLARAREVVGAEGLSIDAHHQAAGNVVLMHRTDDIFDAPDMMSVLCSAELTRGGPRSDCN